MSTCACSHHHVDRWSLVAVLGCLGALLLPLAAQQLGIHLCIDEVAAALQIVRMWWRV